MQLFHITCGMKNYKILGEPESFVLQELTPESGWQEVGVYADKFVLFDDMDEVGYGNQFRKALEQFV